ncbi:hypothetical protein BKA93DRAFT_699681, partial [Sparassis latifolia]
RTCGGLKLDLPAEQSPYAVYPFGLHTQFSLSWNVLVSCNEIFLIFHSCQKLSTDDGQPCMRCHRLHDHDALLGIRSHMFTGCHKNTTSTYYSFSQLTQVLHHKTNEINQLKLKSLNLGRSLVTKTTAISYLNHILMAVAS